MKILFWQVDGVTFWYWKDHYIQIKSPKAPAYFSERNRYDKPVIRLFGWRVFVG